MYTQRRFVLPQFILILFLILSAAAVPTARGKSENEEPPAPVSRSLQRQLATSDEAVSFLVVLRDQLADMRHDQDALIRPSLQHPFDE